MYTLFEHKHRFSAWAASRAASTINCRFSVEQGKEILEVIKLIDLPKSQNAFNLFHREKRNLIIKEALRLNLNFTHGIAAKLINCYFKSMYVNDESIDLNIRNIIHPPIDSLLLDSLYISNIGNKRDFWKRVKNIRWTNFNSDNYEEVIDAIINISGENGLWKIEEYWIGYQ